MKLVSREYYVISLKDFSYVFSKRISLFPNRFLSSSRGEKNAHSHTHRFVRCVVIQFKKKKSSSTPSIPHETAACYFRRYFFPDLPTTKSRKLYIRFPLNFERTSSILYFKMERRILFHVAVIIFFFFLETFKIDFLPSCCHFCDH